MGNRILNREMTAHVLTGYVDVDCGGRDGYGFETKLVNGLKIAGHRGSLIVGNMDSGTEAFAAYVRSLLTFIAAIANLNSRPRARTKPEHELRTENPEA